MPKITSVEPQKKKPHRFNIFLDGQFAFGADEDLVVNRRLVPGKEISQDDLDQILFEAEVGKLMEKMYRLFNIRQRSEKEVRDYLKQLSFRRKLKEKEALTINIINTIIELMKKKGMINDEEFAKAWVEARSKKYGPQRIKQELYQKGIDKEVIEQVLGQRVNESESQTDVATKLLEKKIKTWENLEPMQFRKKAMEFLMRRGFEYELVRSVVEKYIRKEYNYNR